MASVSSIYIYTPACNNDVGHHLVRLKVSVLREVNCRGGTMNGSLIY